MIKINSIIKKIYKSIIGMRFLLFHPRRGLIILFEEHQSLQGSRYIFLDRISLRQLSDNNLPEIKFLSFLGGGSGPTDYLLLLVLANQFNQFNYLEIGTWRGESIRNILELPNCKKAISITLDPKEYVKSNMSIYNSSNVFLNMNDKRLLQIYADSTKYDFSNLGKYDLIFVDGDHSYEAILSDTKNALKLLRDDTSVIFWHDYSYDNDQQVRYSTLNAIKDAIPVEQHQYLYYVENTMSAIFIKKNLYQLNQTSKTTLLYRTDIFLQNLKLMILRV